MVQPNLAYYIEKALQLVGYTDADWAGDVEDRKSTSGYMFLKGVLQSVGRATNKPA